MQNVGFGFMHCLDEAGDLEDYERNGILRYLLDLKAQERDYSVIASLTPKDTKGTCVYCKHCHPCPAGLDIGLINKYYDLSRLGDVLARTPVDPVMRDAGGVDFNYCAGRDRETKLIATLRSPKTGRRMDVITDQPGVQCYTGQGLDHTGKGGVHYGPYAGVCLETQHYPDAINQPAFPSPVLRRGEQLHETTIYRFGVRK